MARIELQHRHVLPEFTRARLSFYAFMGRRGAGRELGQAPALSGSAMLHLSRLLGRERGEIEGRIRLMPGDDKIRLERLLRPISLRAVLEEPRGDSRTIGASLSSGLATNVMGIFAETMDVTTEGVPILNYLSGDKRARDYGTREAARVLLTLIGPASDQNPISVRELLQILSEKRPAVEVASTIADAIRKGEAVREMVKMRDMQGPTNALVILDMYAASYSSVASKVAAYLFFKNRGGITLHSTGEELMGALEMSGAVYELMDAVKDTLIAAKIERMVDLGEPSNSILRRIANHASFGYTVRYDPLYNRVPYIEDAIKALREYLRK